MAAPNNKLPAKIRKQAGVLLSILDALGWIVSFAHYDSQAFGNWYIDLERLGKSIRLVKDRSQFSLEGPSYEERQSAYLEGSFYSFEAFRNAVENWAKFWGGVP